MHSQDRVPNNHYDTLNIPTTLDWIRDVRYVRGRPE